jgi:hypothetical protein
MLRDTLRARLFRARDIADTGKTDATEPSAAIAHQWRGREIERD